MRTRPHTTLFNQVDRTADPDFFVRFMDEAQKPAGIQASKRLILERIAPAPGEAVRDVGCGPGTDVFDMVDLVAPAGRLVGHDASAVMIAEAHVIASHPHSERFRRPAVGALRGRGQRPGAGPPER